MFLDYWMIALFVIAAGAWGEWRNYTGSQKLLEETKEVLKKELAKELQIQRGIGGMNVITKLMAQKVIHYDGNAFIGYQNNKFILPDLSEVTQSYKEAATEVRKRMSI